MGISAVPAKVLPPAVRQFLQQPTGISALLSLGAHALLFALLPLLPYAALVEEKEPEIRQSVEVVELSPEEQARLPEFPTAQLDLPPLFDSLPSAVTDLPPLPVPGQSTAPPPADDLFSDPFFTSSLPNFSIPTLPSAVPFPPAPPVQPRLTPPIVVQPQSPPPSPSPRGLPRLPEGSEGLIPPPDQLGSEPTEPNEDMATNRSDTNSPAPSPSIQPRSDEEIVAALRQDVEARRQQIVLRRQLTYNQAGTADDPNYNPGSSWAGWTAQLEKDYGISLENIDREAKTTIEAPFPSEACESVQEEVTADFGVLIAPDGTPIDGSLAVLRSSGYEFFNHQGGEAILAEGFENTTGKDLPFLVTVVFPYTGDACAGNNAENNAGNNAGNNAENPASPTP